MSPVYVEQPLVSASVNPAIIFSRGRIHGKPERIGINSLGIESGENEPRKPTAACGHSTVCAYQLEWWSFGRKTWADYFSGVTQENGTGAKSEMGEGSAAVVSRKKDQHSTCKAHHVTSCSPENCCLPKGKVGEDQGAAEEGGVELPSVTRTLFLTLLTRLGHSRLRPESVDCL
jgi:hypothetical protein